ncbi:hypothetical protein FQZ97_844610 [compost metagenome]
MALAGFQPTEQADLGQVAACAQLPGRRSMVGRLRGQRAQAVGLQSPGLPPAVVVAQAIQAALRIETRLLQGFAALPARDDFNRPPGLILETAQAEPGFRPGLRRSAPLDPGQGPAIRADARCGIEVGALGQYLPLAIVQGNGNQPVFPLLLLHRQHEPARRPDIAIAAPAIAGQGIRHAGQRLEVELLVRLVDERHATAHQAEGAAAVLVDPAAQREARWCQAVGPGLAPVPQGGAAVGGIEQRPEQAGRAATQFGEVTAGGDGPLRAPGAVPETVVADFKLGR